MERHAVAAGGGDLGKVPFRLDDHQMAVDGAADRVDEGCDRLEHDRAHRDRLHEAPIADVEVEHACSGVEELLDLRAEVREVGRVK